jgi:hypothetical protein
MNSSLKSMFQPNESIDQLNGINFGDNLTQVGQAGIINGSIITALGSEDI